MRISTLASAGIAVALVATLAACGGDDKDSAAQGGTDTSAGAPADPNADSPGAGAPADANANSPGSEGYDPNDQFANAVCPKKEPAKTIVASGFTFCGKAYAAKSGEKWTFDNPDVALHNIATDDLEKNPMKFKSPDVESKQKVTFNMPKKKGKYKMVCDYHVGSMTADVTIT